MKPRHKARALRDGAVLLFAYANYAYYWVFVHLSVANAYLSGICLNGPAAQYCWRMLAIAVLLCQPDHGCPRCFLPHAKLHSLLPCEIYPIDRGLLVAPIIYI